MTDAPTIATIHLAGAIDMLASTRTMIGVIDWTRPAQAQASSEGLDASLAVAMEMLRQLADDLGCRAEIDKRADDAVARTYRIFADHRGGGRA